MKVSVIVPVYNVEKYLFECLKRLVCQSLQEIEIILVNDGSTDKSLDIMLEYEKRFPDKILIVNNTDNSGAGGARNIGLQYASGEYIGFVDADDIVTVEMYEKLYQRAKEGDYDIVDSGYYDESRDKAMLHTSDELCGKLDTEKRKELIVSGGYLVTKIFRRDFLQRADLSFRQDCILEDLETLMKLFAMADSIGNVKEILYCYQDNRSSTSKDVIYDKYFRDTTEAIEAVYRTMSVLENYKDIQEAVEYAIVNLCAVSYNACVAEAAETFKRRNPEWEKKIDKYMKEYISIPCEENQYIKNKIDKDEIERLQHIRVEE